MMGQDRSRVPLSPTVWWSLAVILDWDKIHQFFRWEIQKNIEENNHRKASSVFRIPLREVRCDATVLQQLAAAVLRNSSSTRAALRSQFRIFWRVVLVGGAWAGRREYLVTGVLCLVPENGINDEGNKIDGSSEVIFNLHPKNSGRDQVSTHPRHTNNRIVPSKQLRLAKTHACLSCSVPHQQIAVRLCLARGGEMQRWWCTVEGFVATALFHAGGWGQRMEIPVAGENKKTASPPRPNMPNEQNENTNRSIIVHLSTNKAPLKSHWK
ncbi:hypothetical protein QBC35DRAFT_219314 [Podospora australis]|uniref:Uncharacterized protein n=1 Tax=Podospora australis TaxID=1536484 RepID=A0AAN6WXC9_9PEZI|nr:hypothetical protein QBC35DRAFT_219314 [Podospora australis]